MMFFQILAILVVTNIGLVSAQEAPSICSTGCVTGVFSNGANNACANGDILCVCGLGETFHDGVRDCISQACAADDPSVQIPLAETYANGICASAAAAPPADVSPVLPTSTDVAPVETTTPVEISTPVATSTPATSSTPIVSDTSTSSIAQSSAQSTSVNSKEASTTSPASSPTKSSSTVGSSPTTSDKSSPTILATSSSESESGLSTAVKAGIGAGVGVAVVAAIIITACVCIRRREKKQAASSRARNLKISEPMSGSGRQFANDVSKAEAGLPKPIIKTQPAYASHEDQPNSPTSMYSDSSELESHARRYEDLLPRTQPRTMI